MNRPFNLRKSRDFGQIVSGAFTFLRENLKPFLRNLLAICGLLLLIGLVTSIAQYLSLIGLYRRSANSDDNGSYQAASWAYSYYLGLLFNAFVFWMLQVFIHLTTLSYMAVHLQKEGPPPTLAEVWGYFRYYFFRVLLGSFIVSILSAIGWLVCLIPGIYLSVVFCLLTSIMVMENTSFSYAFNKCFQLIRSNWWLVFGVIIVTSIIILVAWFGINVTFSLIPLTTKFFSEKAFRLPLVIFFSLLKEFLMLAFTVPTIAVALCYFKLSEEKEGIGLLGRIENFGKTTNPGYDLPTEQY